jgi:hypothetical protein
MARCAGCEETIGYGAHLRSIVTNAARVRPIVTCGACGQDNVQRVLSTTLHFLTTVGALVAIGALAYDRATGLRAVPMLVALFFIVEIAWWHVAAHLEKAS